VPISHRCAASHSGRRARKAAIEPAMMATVALMLMLIAICVVPSMNDCISTPPCSGRMNCGSSDRYITAILGFSRLVRKPIANSLPGPSRGSSRTWNGERPPGLTACHARYSR